MQTPTSKPGIRLDPVVTSGQGLENNVWVVGNADEVVVIDASWNANQIMDAVAGRKVVAIICTHAHYDHVNVVEDLRRQTGAPVLAHPDDAELWDESVPTSWDEDAADGDVIEVAGLELRLLHTPGHTPGSCCIHAPALTAVFTGDTLFQGGPGATRWEYSSFETIIDSIASKLLVLPAQTLVLTGHGPATTIGQEAPDQDEWIARGW